MKTRSRSRPPSTSPKYEAKEVHYGKDSRSTFGGHAWDSYTCFSAVAVPEALEEGEARHEGVRLALRDALERTNELVASHGVFTMTPQDHNGLDNRARTMIKIENGQWVLVK